MSLQAIMADNLKLLRAVTNNFSPTQRVGSGYYGDVYWAMLDDGKEIAVKNFRQLEGQGNDMVFTNEVRNLIDIEHHPNIIRLLGYCYVPENIYVEREGKVPIEVQHVHRVLWFEYMQGRSLEKYISVEKPCDFDWATCYKIVRGMCEGLKHLHTVKEKPIYHMDLKPANILLDNNKTPKIGDLGSSMLVANRKTHKAEILRGPNAYMPPEYMKQQLLSRKFDVFSLGVIIIQMLAGTNAYVSHRNMTPEEFTKLVTEMWKEKLQSMLGDMSQRTALLQVKACVYLGLRCVKYDRNERPDIMDIVSELEEVEARIRQMWQTSIDSIAVDPSLELRFLFEPGKEISCCLQLTNKTSDSIAFNIKTNPTKYYTVPSRGIMAPCSRHYVSVTLRAQEAPPNMQCHDMLIVQSVNLSKEPTSSNVEINEDFFKKVKTEKVYVLTLPIVYVALDQHRAFTPLTANDGQAQERDSRLNPNKRALGSRSVEAMDTS